MKTLIIPDIHDKIDVVDTIIEKEPSDQIVFLGDYFDSYNEDVDSCQKTALWLKKSLKHENRIHLIGNHDLSYISNGKFPCSGFNNFKLWAINKVLTTEDWDKLYFHTWVDKWLCTHAGLSNNFYQEYFDNRNVIDFMNEESKIALDSIKSGFYHKFFFCSQARGGWDGHAGIVWCDYDEFEPVLTVNQIFGHTRGVIRQKMSYMSTNYCIDTFLNNYAVHENGKMEIKNVA